MTNFTEEEIEAVWRKGKPLSNNSPERYRYDECGAWMDRKEYGNRKSPDGWEIDHISPGGPDTLDNLRPLNWANNVEKSDGRLKCRVKASGIQNVEIR
jgi:hypothetical protein